MGRFIKGDVVVVPFPFSDLSGNQKRPTLVIADLPGEDIILCQITSKHKSDSFAIPLNTGDFSTGVLPIDSFIRPNKIFTAYKTLILSIAGHLSDVKIHETLKAIVNIISS
jgi:mRNA interferase MazF